MIVKWVGLVGNCLIIIKSFLHYKLKTMIRIQSVNDLQLVLKWQDRVLECQSLIALKELNHKLYNQALGIRL